MSNQPRGSFGPLIEQLLLHYRKPVVLLVQLALVGASYVASFILRLGLDPGQVPWDLVIKTLPLLLVVRLAILMLFRLYQGLWRYVEVQDLLQIVKAITVSSAIFMALEIPIFGLAEFPRSVFVLDWAGSIFLLSGIRLLVRLLREKFLPLQSLRNSAASPKRLLIIGAGDAGAILCKEALSNSAYQYHPVAFVDDDTNKLGRSILGVSIVGRFRDIPRVVGKHRVDLAVIALPTATPAERRTILEICKGTGVEFKVLPATADILEGRISISQIREVDPMDLLGRPPAQLDRAVIGHFIQGKRVLVTGAAGSVGSELSRQIALLRPEIMLLIDQSENPLYFLESDLRSMFPDNQPVTLIADVTDQAAMHCLFAEYRPQIVFHAAGHKHVPFMERTPAKAVHNNVGGAYLLAMCAQEFEVQKFVFVSTDKAVRPTSVMGATKRLGEMLMQELNHHGSTQFMAVRFGNVMGSSASVVPTFKQQIANGGPVTVTHPDVTRYFMSLSEAAGLILQAGAIGAGGDIFLLDMGDPVRIVDLAETLITLSGLEPHEDIDIVFTELRPGEKLHEELYSEGETLMPTGYDKLFALNNHHITGNVVGDIEEFLRLLPGLQRDEVKAHLKRLVPEYQPSGTSATRVEGAEDRTH